MEFDIALKNLHPDWQFIEWDLNNTKEFIQHHYPGFYRTWSNYDVPVKQHDAARYLILNHYGGVFIQHSIKLTKSLEPLLKEMKFVAAYQASDSISNGFIASIDHHPVLKQIIKALPVFKKKFVLEATGPGLITKFIKQHIKSTDDEYISILDRKYIYPFDWIEKHQLHIQEACYNSDNCFELFPEAYGYCLWSKAW